VLAVCGCAPEENRPYLKMVGGGFVFNYRLATADYGFVARVMHTLPDGTIVRATFEDPAGGDPIVVEQARRAGAVQYVFQTPPLQGVRRERDYRVVLALVDATTGTVIETHERTFRSDYDQEQLPAAPLTVGPGYRKSGEIGGRYSN